MIHQTGIYFRLPAAVLAMAVIRLGEPKKLAEFLLRNETAWNEIRNRHTMNSVKEKMGHTSRTVPVIITISLHL
jgi:murein L,D-transpeptidase YcbB/YkuD